MKPGLSFPQHLCLSRHMTSNLYLGTRLCILVHREKSMLPHAEQLDGLGEVSSSTIHELPEATPHEKSIPHKVMRLMASPTWFSEYLKMCSPLPTGSKWSACEGWASRVLHHALLGFSYYLHLTTSLAGLYHLPPLIIHPTFPSLRSPILLSDSPLFHAGTYQCGVERRAA